MIPTSKLRFVERTVELSPFYMTVNEKGETTRGAHTYRVLQQWWADTDEVFDTVTKDIRGEWRDVPLESEK